MLDTLILILTLLLKAASLWFLAVALFALRKPKRYAVCAPRTRFACLVAARNEEAVIGALVESLKKQDTRRSRGCCRSAMTPSASSTRTTSRTSSSSPA